MRGTSSSDDKLADDLGNAIEGTRISGRRSDFSTAGKSAPGHLGLLQQYRHYPDVPASPHSRRVLEGKRTYQHNKGAGSARLPSCERFTYGNRQPWAIRLSKRTSFRMSRQRVEGRCLCRAVIFEYDAEPNWTLHGHCESCRRATSSPMTTWISVPRSAFRFKQGTPLSLRQYRLTRLLIAGIRTHTVNRFTHRPRTASVT
jgi:hypothetical protein